MKRLIKNTIGFIAAIFIVAISAINVQAASATLTGPGTVRAGDTIQLKLQIPDAKRYGLEGTLSYDSNQVSLSSVTTPMKGWVVEQNGNSLVAYDNEFTSPTSANSTVLVLNFKVKSNVAAGTVMKISITGLTSTDGNNENNYGTVTYSVTIAKPLSNVNTLSALVVDGQTLSPAFNSNTTSYNLGEVEYSVSTLKVTATATDSKAKVTVSGNNLVVGKNTITITVKAENGSTKTYQIVVTRKQDPNYKASNNANMSQITLSAGQLSPAFSSNLTEYVVYMPYEMIGKSIDLSGKAHDSKAIGVKGVKLEKLAEGANVATLVCTAEDGSTKEYKVTVYVMPKYDGNIPVIGGDDVETPTVPPIEVPTKPEDEPTIEMPTEDTTQAPTVDDDSDDDVNTENDNDAVNKIGFDDKWKIIVFASVGAVVGFVIAFLIFGLKKKSE